MSAKRTRKHPIDQKITNSKKFGNGKNSENSKKIWSPKKKIKNTEKYENSKKQIIKKKKKKLGPAFLHEIVPCVTFLRWLYLSWFEIWNLILKK